MLPEHIAIIMDGNGRWASGRGLMRAAGHREGANAVEKTVKAARRRGVGKLTLFAFSSENWRRPQAEIDLLLRLLRRTLARQIQRLKDNGIRIHFVGARHNLSAAVVREMAEAEAYTAANQDLDLIVAVDYGGRWDMVQAARSCARECVERGLAPEDIDESVFAGYRSLARFTEPDLFIRTGGERRISNFLLWDLAYSELYFCDEYWPDFDGDSLEQALTWYEKRERRFGQVPDKASAS